MRKIGMATFLTPRRRAVWAAFCAFIAVCVFSFSSAKASILVAGYTVPTANAAGLNATTVAPGATASALASSVAITELAGTTINAAAAGGSTATEAMHIASSAGGNTITIALSGLASGHYSDFILTYAAANAGGTARTQSWAWSVNGTTFSTTGVTQPGGIAGSSGFALNTVNFGAVTALNGSGTVDFRLTLAGGTSGADFDNFAVTAVPEPINYALAGFGFIFVGVGAGRFYFHRKKVSSAV